MSSNKKKAEGREQKHGWLLRELNGEAHYACLVAELEDPAAYFNLWTQPECIACQASAFQIDSTGWDSSENLICCCRQLTQGPMHQKRHCLRSTMMLIYLYCTPAYLNLGLLATTC